MGTDVSVEGDGSPGGPGRLEGDRPRGAVRGSSPEGGAEFVVTGAVQGVGFRPFVFRTATALGLVGSVVNDERGVVVRAFGTAAGLDGLAATLRDAPPAGARVDRVTRRALDPEPGLGGFTVEFPQSGAAELRRISIGPDLATCPDCLAEIADPTARRYRYPFTNCTACGPRYTIATALPYERENTTMAGFELCDACRAEYGDVADRRFHAQPIACPDCGPSLELFGSAGGSTGARGDAALAQAADALSGGRIVAVLGLGGFHLMVRADDAAAVEELRRRKRRGDKPFAVLVGTAEDARACFREPGALSADEERLLASPAAPIVLVRTARAPERIADAVAPASADLGVLLAPTPLHRLLADAVGVPLVATSGNLSEEPMATTLEEGVRDLAGIADLFLVHDRPIARPVDDSLVRVVLGRTLVLRRARGYAPLWVDLPGAADDVALAVGAHQKSTVALATGGRALLSPHIGDLAGTAARDLHARVAADLEALAARTPLRIACDAHPDYASTLYAESRTGGDDAPRIVRVQHHHAHASAALAECVGGISDVVALTWDGSGAGADGTVWGGEAFRCTPSGWERVASLETFALPGGERAVREPWRVAAGLLESVFGDAVPAPLDEALAAAAMRAGAGTHCGNVRAVARSPLAPRTSSVGRLFDAFAGLVGLCSVQSFEADAAQRVEAAAARVGAAAPYPFPLAAGTPRRVQLGPFLRALAADLSAGVDVDALCARFHMGLAALCATLGSLAEDRRVLLTGGCFQNRTLLEAAARALEAAGLEPLWPSAVPVGDGGIAYGQLAHLRLFAGRPA